MPPSTEPCGCHERERIKDSQCDWKDDPNWLDGATRLAVPSSELLKAFWDADILRADGTEFDPQIVEITEDFTVRFRVELQGRLWRCMSGHWCFDLLFSAIGEGSNFNLSTRLGRQIEVQWAGCERLCIEEQVRVPARTIAAGDCGTVYKAAAKYMLHCCDRHVLNIVAGYEDKGDVEFFDPGSGT